MSGKRERVSKELDKKLVKDISEHIRDMSEQYDLYVAIGKLKGIRNTARKGNYKGRMFRGMIHSWAFARVTKTLTHGLAQQGWSVKSKDSRFRVVPETWTSIMCWKCGSKGTRPKQNYFYCSSCGYSINADQNGSINIAARLLTLTKSLHYVRGLGLWTRSVVRGTANRRAQLKARKKNPSSKGKSLLSKKEPASGSGESAAVHFVQSDLLIFGDKSKMSDNDPAVERTVEMLSVTGSDAPVSKQEKEARTSGGIPSR